MSLSSPPHSRRFTTPRRYTPSYPINTFPLISILLPVPTYSRHFPAYIFPQSPLNPDTPRDKMVNTPTLPKIPLTIYTSPSPHQAATTQNIHFHILDLPDPSRPSLTRASLTRPDTSIAARHASVICPCLLHTHTFRLPRVLGCTKGLNSPLR